MKKSVIFLHLGLAICLVMVSAGAEAFSFTGIDFSGTLAYDASGDVVGLYGLDPAFDYDHTGVYFNTAASLTFSFEYLPTFPSVPEILSQPGTDWYWSATVRNLRLPCQTDPISEMSWDYIGSYSDLIGRVNWGQTDFGAVLPNNFAYSFDYQFDTETTGTARLDLLVDFDQSLIPDQFPDQYFGKYSSDLEVEISASPITTPVPEPLSLIMLSAGLAGMTIIKRRK